MPQRNKRLFIEEKRESSIIFLRIFLDMPNGGT